MKKYFIISLLIASAVGCNNGEMSPEMQSLTNYKDSLQRESERKDSSINAFLSSFNEIQTNLNTIKEKEKIVTLNSANAETQKSNQEQIVEDINMINELLTKNKSKIASLQKKLKGANLKINELQKMIETLTKQMEDKDAEITTLKTKLTEANAALESMFVIYHESVVEGEQKTAVIEEQTTKLNTAFYAFGTAKELIKQGVLTKEGGFIGMGKAQKLKDDFNKEYFTKVDITKTNSIDIFMKKAKLVTTHPSNSYKWEGTEKKVDKLIITNSEEFWGTSKYLVIVVE